MTAVIKSRDPQAASARALTLAAAVSGPLTLPIPAVDPEVASLRLQAETLAQQLRLRDADIAGLKAAADAAFRKGEAQGRVAGLAAADARSGERLVALEAGIGVALSRFSEGLAGLEQLAVALAHEGLAKIVLEPELQAPLIAGAIRKAIATLERDTLVTATVSRADFDDEAALQALATAVDWPAMALTASSDVPAGECRLRLQLGGLEIGLTHQWARLSAALRDMAEEPDG